MVKRFKNKLCQSATYVISIGIEGGVVHVHRMAKDLQGNLFQNGKNKHFRPTLCFVAIWYWNLFEYGKNKRFSRPPCASLQFGSQVGCPCIEGPGKRRGRKCPEKRLKRLCTEKGGKRNINDQQRRLQPGTSQTYHGSNLNQKGQVELSLKLKVHFL